MSDPSSWESVRIGDALDLINGRAFKPKEWTTAGRPIIRIQNLNNPEAAFNYYAGALPEKFSVATGDLLFAWSGTPGTSFGAHIWKGSDAWLNQHIFKVIFQRDVFDRRFLRFAINQNLAQYIGVAHGGAGLAHITKGRFEASVIPLPPLNEQKRIVAKIEELFSELDAGEESLRTARQQLGVYRQSLLKQAFEGNLTAKWRAKNGRTETASDLLVRIQERRKANGALAGKRTDPVPPNGDFESVIPDGWLVVSMDALTSHITSGSRDWTQYYQEDGYAVFVMAQNVRPLRFDSTPVVRVSPPEFDRDKSRSAIGCDDLLVTIVGANTGDVCRVEHKFENYYVCQSVALLRPAEPATAAYLELYMNSQEHGQKQFQQWMYGQGRPHLSFDQLRSTAVCLPPLPEQQEIVRLLDEQFEAIAQNEREIDAALQKSAALRQAILKKAFTGQLVPQDPADEPASVLLARLRAGVTQRKER